MISCIVCTRWNALSETIWSEPKLKMGFHHDDPRVPQPIPELTLQELEDILEIVAPSLKTLSLSIPSRESNVTSVKFSSGMYLVNNLTINAALHMLSNLCYGARNVKTNLSHDFPVTSFVHFLNQNEKLEQLLIEGNYEHHLHDLDNDRNDFVERLKRLGLVCCHTKSVNSLRMVHVQDFEI